MLGVDDAILIPRIASVDEAAAAFKSPIRLLYIVTVVPALDTIPFTPGIVLNAPLVERS